METGRTGRELESQGRAWPCGPRLGLAGAGLDGDLSLLVG